MTYRAPVEDIAFTLKHAAGMGDALTQGLYGDLDTDVIDVVLGEAGKFASDVIAPLNRIGDKHGTPFDDGAVMMPPGWKEAYKSWAAAGWNGLAAPEKFGGQELPHALNAACIEMWNAASMSFGIGPVLTMGAVEALAVHGSDALKRVYLPKLVSGEWTASMQLTESQAGSDVGALRTKAERQKDGGVGEQNVGDAHEHAVHRAGVVTCQHPHQRTQRGSGDVGREADEERHLRAVQHTA